MGSPYEDFVEKEIGKDRIKSTNSNEWSVQTPWRDDKNPSMSINIKTGLWKDHGEGKGGNHITLIERLHSLDRSNAIEYIKKNYPSLTVQAARPPVSVSSATVGSPEDYRFIEVVTGAPQTNRKSAIIEEVKSSIFEIDCFSQPDSVERHGSVYLHNEGLKNHWLKNGSVGGYRGAVKPEFFHFDFDCDGYPEAALSDARVLLQRLKEYKVVDSDLRFYFSGNKGFHLYVYNEELALLAGSEAAPDKVKKAAQLLGCGLRTMDLAVYDRTRLLRVANSLNPKSGLFKIPLTVDEFNGMSMTDIRIHAKTKRRI